MSCQRILGVQGDPAPLPGVGGVGEVAISEGDCVGEGAVSGEGLGQEFGERVQVVALTRMVEIEAWVHGWIIITQLQPEKRLDNLFGSIKEVLSWRSLAKRIPPAIPEALLTAISSPLFRVFMPPTIMAAMERTLFSGYIAEGDQVAELSKRVGEYLGNRDVTLVNSCTMALTIAYRLAGVGPGDEVITTPLTCVASNQPILSLGAKPVWADVERETGMLDPESVRAAITDRTKAVMVLHKEGQPARLDALLAICREHGIKLVEDSAHAFGARWRDGQRIGNHGDYACFSFQAIKHMTTGDGGALVCKTEEDTARARRMKWFGVDKHAPHAGNPWLADIPEWGYKANMNDISATLGLAQMDHIEEIIEKHHRNGRRYGELLAGAPGIQLMQRDPECWSTFWAYDLLVEEPAEREPLIATLASEGISAGVIHHRNDVYSMFEASRRDLPNVDWFAVRELSLPCGWWIEEAEVERICDVIKAGAWRGATS